MGSRASASLAYASRKERKQLAAALRPVCTALNAEAAEHTLAEFERGVCGRRHPDVAAAWRRAWERVIPFFACPPAVRKLIYTTNAIESLHSQLRKIIKTRGHLPSDDAATRLIWLALRNIAHERHRTVREWREAMNRFAIAYGERFTRADLQHGDTDLPTASLGRLVASAEQPAPWTSLRGLAPRNPDSSPACLASDHRPQPRH